MAKGAESKNIIFEKLQEIYPGSFWEDQGKILRIPMDEAGQRVEIKVSLTAAKANLGGNQVESAFEAGPAFTPAAAPTIESSSIEPTEEEKNNVRNLMNALNLSM